LACPAQRDPGRSVARSLAIRQALCLSLRLVSAHLRPALLVSLPRRHCRPDGCDRTVAGSDFLEIALPSGLVVCHRLAARELGLALSPVRDGPGESRKLDSLLISDAGPGFQRRTNHPGEPIE